MRPILNFNILRVEFPQEIIDELNEHIDSEIIPKSESYADGLVGQLKNNEKSAQLTFPLDTDVGKQLETVFNQLGNYLSERRGMTVMLKLRFLSVGLTMHMLVTTIRSMIMELRQLLVYRVSCG